MMEIKIASRTCPDELGRPRTFHYALTVDTVEAGPFSCENYGVRISEEQGDSVSIPGITTSALRIDELMMLDGDIEAAPLDADACLFCPVLNCERRIRK